MADTETPAGEQERCGWRVQRAQHAITGELADFVRVSNGTVWFYMPIDVYEDCDDKAFTTLCQHYAQQIMAKTPGTHVPGAIPSGGDDA